MDELQEKIVSAVSDAGGSIAWGDLMQSLTHGEQQRATEHIRVLENQGVLARKVERNAATGEVTFTVDSVAQAPKRGN